MDNSEKDSKVCYLVVGFKFQRENKRDKEREREQGEPG